MTTAKSPKIRKTRFAKSRGFSLLLAVAIAFLSRLAHAEAPQFFSFQTHSHLTFPVEADVSYVVEKISEKGKDVGLKIVFKNASSTRLAQVNATQASLSDLTKFRDQRTSKVAKKVSGSDVVFEVFFSEEAKRAGIDFFDYRNRASSEVSLDYWQAAKAAAAKGDRAAQESRVPASKAGAVKKVAQPPLKPKTPTTMTAGDGCSRPLVLGRDEFTLWKVYHKSFDYAAAIGLKFPDEKYQYPDPMAVKNSNVRSLASEDAHASKDSNAADDIDHYALALKLYQKKKFGLALRTIDFFEKQFPKSELSQEMQFLKANALMKLSAELKSDRLRQQALDILHRVATTEAASERAKWAQIYGLQEVTTKGRATQVLETAVEGAKRKDEFEPLYTLATAEALQEIGELDRAEKTYDAVVALDPKGPLAPEAAFRKGEIKFQKSHFEDALDVFISALRNYPDKINSYPTAVFNLAETYFRLHRFSEAREMFDEFRTRFKHDKARWAADLRIPEIDQIKLNDADRKISAEEIKREYEAVVNLHPYSPGEFIAELRLANCIAPVKTAANERERHFFNQFFAKKDVEAQQFPLINQPELRRLTDLAEIQFKNQSGEYRAVLGVANDYRDKLATFQTRESFEIEFDRAARGAVIEAANESKYKEVLSIDDKYGDMVKTPVPFSYQLALARALHGLKRLRDAEIRLADVEKSLALASSEEKDEYHFLKFQNDRLLKAENSVLVGSLRSISDDGALSSKKYMELAALYTEIKDVKQAIECDSKLLDQPRVKSLSAREVLRAQVRRLDNLLQSGDFPSALKIADRVLLTKGTHTELVAQLNRVRDIRAVALYRLGQYGQALVSFDEILGLVPEHPRKTEFEFLKAKCLDGLHRDQEALESFRKIATSDKGIWGKSAKVEIESKEFKTKQ